MTLTRLALDGFLPGARVERYGQRRLIAAEETRSRPGRQNAEVLAGSNGTRKGLAPEVKSEGWAHNGDLHVGAHAISACLEDSTHRIKAESRVTA